MYTASLFFYLNPPKGVGKCTLLSKGNNSAIKHENPEQDIDATFIPYLYFL